MEDTLGDLRIIQNQYYNICLNPCSNGRYSRRPVCMQLKINSEVLILVLMEDTLGAIMNIKKVKDFGS